MGLDGELENRWDYYDVNTAPRVYDIVLCRFPFVEDPDTPPSHHRSPCLVKAVRLHSSRRAAFVTVAVGTSNLKTERRSDIDLIIHNASDMHEMGLAVSTRFDLDRIFDLPWARQWFPIPNGRMTPKLGSLNQTYIGLLRRRAQRRSQLGLGG